MSDSHQTSELHDLLALYETEKRLQYEQTKFIFEQSKTYHTIVMGLAYGGFFALWSSAKAFVNDAGLLATAASLMLVSILSFTLFTILNMYLLQQASLKNAKLAQSFGNPTTSKELRKSISQIATYRTEMNSGILAASARLARWWAPFFYTSLSTGIFAALLMLYILLRHQIS